MADVLRKVNNAKDYINGAAIVTASPLPVVTGIRLAHTINAVSYTHLTLPTTPYV